MASAVTKRSINGTYTRELCILLVTHTKGGVLMTCNVLECNIICVRISLVQVEVSMKNQSTSITILHQSGSAFSDLKHVILIIDTHTIVDY
jgi:hypothetical protein